jgi:S-adenosylmethionine decarboxylase
MYGEPIIFSPGGDGREENQGFDAFVPLIDSGISLYVWSNARFFSVIIYTCKSFDAQRALDFTKAFFQASEVVSQEF